LGQIVADAAGNLYLAEADRGIRKIAADGTITTIVSNRDAATVVQRDGVIDNIGALEAKFDDILFLAVGPDGSVFFVHSAGSTIYQLTPDGHVSTIAGKEEGGFGGDGGPARDAQFKNIFGIAVDASGNVYVSDRNNLRIRKLTPDAASQAGGGDTGGTTGGGDTGGGQTGGGDTGSGGDTSTGGGDTTPSVDLPTGDRGPIALDLDETTGDQAKVQTDTNPASGDKVVIDIVAVSGASGNIGFQVVLAYDAAQLQFDGFAAKDLWAAGLPIVPPASGGEAQIQVALLGQTASSDVGSMGHATFTALDGFTGTAKVEIKSASYDNPVTVGSGGQFVVIGGAVVTIPSDPVEASDFSGDGTVDFSDFLTFAQNFGKSSSDSDFNTRIDLNQDGSVDFADFLAFAQQFGKSTGG
jgi:hypothetical protein